VLLHQRLVDAARCCVRIFRMTFPVQDAVPRALVTGANGFVGSQLCPMLEAGGWHIVAVNRTADRHFNSSGISDVVLPLSSDAPGWQRALVSVSCVVHLAAHVHRLRRDARSPDEFRAVNVDGTRFVAEQAAQAGVHRFIYLSSIKVNGEGGSLHAYRADDAPAPHDPYGRSKWEAEVALRDVCARFEMDLVIIRPPLVYGPGVRANFKRLLNLAASGLPLPLRSIHNQRSMINVWNLTHFIETCMRHPEAPGETFLVSDGVDLSTPQLFDRLSSLLHKRPRLFPFPPQALRLAARMLGMSAEMRRLCESLIVDSRPARERLGWQPIVSVDEGLARTVAAYRRECAR
jgi:nucleoside-diphosphate-sugar epimerase